MINQDFKSILDLTKAFPDEQTCINHLTELRWGGKVVSPFDRTSKVYECKGNKYKCKNTGKYFNVKTSTLFDNTKIELQKWFIAIWLVTSHDEGISSVQLAKEIDITAPEIIKTRASADKPNMGLTSWKGKNREDKILPTDIRIAKNYLTQKELDELNRLVSVYLEQAELMASRGKLITMNEWADRLNAFLQFNGYEILKNAGSISRKIADRFAMEEFDKFRVIQDKEYQSDFDKVVSGISTTGNLPKEALPKTLSGTFTVSVKEEMEKKEKEVSENLSDFNASLKTALKYNPKK